MSATRSNLLILTIVAIGLIITPVTAQSTSSMVSFTPEGVTGETTDGPSPITVGVSDSTGNSDPTVEPLTTDTGASAGTDEVTDINSLTGPTIGASAITDGVTEPGGSTAVEGSTPGGSAPTVASSTIDVGSPVTQENITSEGTAGPTFGVSAITDGVTVPGGSTAVEGSTPGDSAPTVASSTTDVGSPVTEENITFESTAGPTFGVSAITDGVTEPGGSTAVEGSTPGGSAPTVASSTIDVGSPVTQENITSEGTAGPTFGVSAITDGVTVPGGSTAVEGSTPGDSAPTVASSTTDVGSPVTEENITFESTAGPTFGVSATTDRLTVPGGSTAVEGSTPGDSAPTVASSTTDVGSPVTEENITFESTAGPTFGVSATTHGVTVPGGSTAVEESTPGSSAPTVALSTTDVGSPVTEENITFESTAGPTFGVSATTHGVTVPGGSTAVEESTPGSSAPTVASSTTDVGSPVTEENITFESTAGPTFGVSATTHGVTVPGGSTAVEESTPGSSAPTVASSTTDVGSPVTEENITFESTAGPTFGVSATTHGVTVPGGSTAVEESTPGSSAPTVASSTTDVGSPVTEENITFESTAGPTFGVSAITHGVTVPGGSTAAEESTPGSSAPTVASSTTDVGSPVTEENITFESTAGPTFGVSATTDRLTVPGRSTAVEGSTPGSSAPTVASSTTDVGSPVTKGVITVESTAGPTIGVSAITHGVTVPGGSTAVEGSTPGGSAPTVASSTTDAGSPVTKGVITVESTTGSTIAVSARTQGSIPTTEPTTAKGSTLGGSAPTGATAATTPAAETPPIKPTQVTPEPNPPPPGNVTVPEEQETAATTTELETQAPETTSKKQLSFRSDETFIADLLNSKSEAFTSRASLLKTQLEPLYKKAFTSFQSLEVTSFQQGSIINNMDLIFSTDSVQNNDAIGNVVIEAAESITAFNIDTTSVSVDGTTIVPPVIVTPEPNPPPPGNVTVPEEQETAATTTELETQAPETTSKKQLSFRSDETFIADLLNSKSEAFTSRASLLKTELEPLYKEAFTSFQSLEVTSFQEGSIINNMDLIFSTDSSVLNNDAIGNVVIDAAENITAFNINTTSVSVDGTTIVPPVIVTPEPNPPPPVIVTAAPETTSKRPLSFRSDETFTADLLNSESGAFTSRASLLKTQLEPLYKKAFTSFQSLEVTSFQQGSIINNMNLIFSTDSSVPNNNDIGNVVIEAAESITAFNIDTTSVSVDGTTIVPPVIVTPEPNPPPPVIVTAAPETTSKKQLSFRSDETFTADLLNSESGAFTSRASLLKTQLEPLYKKAFTSFQSLEVTSFQEGSIINNMNLIFSTDSSVPNNNDIGNVVIEAAESITAFNIDTTSVSVDGTTIVPPVIVTPEPNPPPPGIVTVKPTPRLTTPTAEAPPQVVILAVVVQQVFVEALNDRESDEFKKLAEEVTAVYDLIYSLQFGSIFLRSFIIAFRPAVSRQRATNTESEVGLEFNSESSEEIPDSEAVADTLKEALTNPNISLNITFDVDSIRVVETTPTPGTLFSSLLTFKTDGTFTNDLLDSNSEAFRNRSTLLTETLEPFFSSALTTFRDLVVLSFSQGSIVNNMLVRSTSIQSSEEIRDVLSDAAKNITEFTIDPNSIIVAGTMFTTPATVTENSSGGSHMFSLVTSFCVVLLSWLLSSPH